MRDLTEKLLNTFASLATPSEWILSPDGETVMFCESVNGVLQIFSMPVMGGFPRRLTATLEDCHEPQWSPDGKQIAYLSMLPPGSQGCGDCSRVPGLAAPLDQRSQIRMRWRIADVETGQARTLVTFAPTANFITLLPYFDQYARSLTFWSPDSKRFVYAQREAQGTGSVWVTEITENATPTKVGDGTLAVWSWK